jgi:hypothetical protein
MARSVATPQIVHSASSCQTMDCFVSSDSTVAIVGWFRIIRGLIEEMIMGRTHLSMTVLVQLNFGSNVASQGYPKSISSCPISIMRKHISLLVLLVHTFKSRKCVIIPDLFDVLSMLKIFFGVESICYPNPILFANAGCIMLSVAPESTNAFLLAMK